jgi:hypothetical protein
MSQRDALKYAGVQHAKRGWQLHTAAGGPANVPTYASIDDDPSFEQHQAQVAPYLRGWEYVGGVGVDINDICKPQFGQWA